MHSLFRLLFKLAWLNVLLFAARQANLTVQWNVSHDRKKCVGSFWSGTKEIEKHLLTYTHFGTYVDVCETEYICSFAALAHLDRNTLIQEKQKTI